MSNHLESVVPRDASGKAQMAHRSCRPSSCRSDKSQRCPRVASLTFLKSEARENDLTNRQFSIAAFIGIRVGDPDVLEHELLTELGTVTGNPVFPYCRR